jgi:hypothetical protein
MNGQGFIAALSMKRVGTKPPSCERRDPRGRGAQQLCARLIWPILRPYVTPRVTPRQTNATLWGAALLTCQHLQGRKLIGGQPATLWSARAPSKSIDSTGWTPADTRNASTASRRGTREKNRIEANSTLAYRVFGLFSRCSISASFSASRRRRSRISRSRSISDRSFTNILSIHNERIAVQHGTHIADQLPGLI